MCVNAWEGQGGEGFRGRATEGVWFLIGSSGGVGCEGIHDRSPGPFVKGEFCSLACLPKAAINYAQIHSFCCNGRCERMRLRPGHGA